MKCRFLGTSNRNQVVTQKKKLCYVRRRFFFADLTDLNLYTRQTSALTSATSRQLVGEGIVCGSWFSCKVFLSVLVVLFHSSVSIAQD